jgi:membrane-associated phospholipid phosphatase
MTEGTSNFQKSRIYVKNQLKVFHKNEHRLADLLASMAAFILLIAMSTMVSASEVPNWEVNSFRAINDLPNWIFPIVWPFMQYGVFATIPVVAALAFYYKKIRLALLLLIGGIGIYYLARYIKVIVPRGRPEALLDNIHIREKFALNSSGFTSGHAAVAATIATFSYRYLSRNWRVVSIVALVLVMFSRIYIEEEIKKSRN